MLNEFKVAITADISKIKNSLSSVEKQVKKLDTVATKANTDIAKSAKTQAANIKDAYVKEIDFVVRKAQKELKLLKKEFENVYDWTAGGKNRGGELLENISGKITDTEKLIKLMKEYREGIEGGSIDVDVGSLEEVPQAVSEVSNSMVELQRAVETGTEWKVFTENIKKLCAEYDKLINSLMHKSINNPNFKPSDDQLLKIRQLQKEITKLVAKIAELKGITQDQVVLRLDAAGMSAAQTILEVNHDKEYGIERPESTVKKAAKSSAAKSSSGSSRSSIGKDLKNILKGIVGIRSLYFLVRRIVSQNQALTQSITNIISVITTALKPVLDLIAALINGLAKIIAKIFKVDWEAATSSSETAENTRSLAGFDEIERVGDGTSAGSSSSSTEIPTVKEAMSNIKDSLADIGEWFDETIEKLGLGELCDEIVEDIQTITDEAEPALGKFGTWLQDLWENTIKPIWYDHIVPCLTDIYDMIKVALAWIWGLFEPFIDTLLECLGALYDNIVDLIRGVIDIFGGFCEFIAGAFTGDWEKALEGIKKIFKGVWDSIVALFKIGVNTALGIINTVIAAINTVFNGVISFVAKIVNGLGNVFPSFKNLDIQTVNIPKINYLAKGGIVDSPTAAMIGENGKEAVVPLENNTEWIDKLVARFQEAGTPTTIQLVCDKRVFGQVAIEGINGITKSTGKLQLAL